MDEIQAITSMLPHEIHVPLRGMIIFGCPRSGTNILGESIHAITKDWRINGLSPTYLEEWYGSQRLYDTKGNFKTFHDNQFMLLHGHNKDISTMLRHAWLVDSVDRNRIWPILNIHSNHVLNERIFHELWQHLRETQYLKILTVRRDLDNQLASMLLMNITGIAHVHTDEEQSAYLDKLDQLRSNPISVNGGLLAEQVAVLLIHLQWYALFRNEFDQIIWYDQWQSRDVGIARLGIEPSMINEVISQSNASRRMNASAADTLRSCVTNWSTIAQLIGDLNAKCKWILPERS